MKSTVLLEEDEFLDHGQALPSDAVQDVEDDIIGVPEENEDTGAAEKTVGSVRKMTWLADVAKEDIGAGEEKDEASTKEPGSDFRRESSHCHSMDSMVLLEEGESRDHRQALPSDPLQDDVGTAEENENSEAPEKTVVTVMKVALPTDVAKEDVGAGEENDEASTKEPGSDSGCESSLANQVVSRHSLIQSLVSGGTDRTTVDDSRKAQRSRRGGRHEEEGMNMPAELLEIIISRMPFPSVFKAQTLSKSWSSKFPLLALTSLQSVSLKPLQSVKSFQPSLQNLICSVSPHWTTYSPVYFTTEDILGFDQTSSAWKSIADLRYLSASLSAFFNPPGSGYKCLVTTSGPLLLCTICSRIPDRYTFLVSNVITKSSKLLETTIEPDDRPSLIRILPMSTVPGHYKVLLLYPYFGATHIYKSSNPGWGKWTMRFFDPHPGEYFSTSAYVNRNLYCLYMDKDDVYSVLTLMTFESPYDFWMEPAPQTLLSREIRDGAILACESKVMAAIWFLEPGQAAERRPGGIESVKSMIGIFQLDFETLKLEEVGRGPPLSVCEEAFGESKLCVKMKFSSDANFIYFAGNDNIEGRQLRVIAYDIQSCVWSCLPPSPPHARLYEAPMDVLAFQPGINPFMSP